MACKKFRNLILDDILGTIKPDERQALHEHLRSCPACAEEKEKSEKLLVRISDQKEFDPGDAYWESFNKRVFSKIAERSGRERWVLTAPLRIRFAAALVIAVLALVLLPFAYRYFVQQHNELITYEENLQAALNEDDLQDSDEIIDRVVPFYQHETVFSMGFGASYTQNIETADWDVQESDGFVPYSLIDELDESEEEALMSQIEQEMS